MFFNVSAISGQVAKPITVVLFASVMLLSPILEPLNLGVQTADANAQQCRGLSAELASLSKNAGNRAQYRKYDQALRKQRTQLQRAEQQAKRSRCGPTLFKSPQSAICQRLDSVTDKMKRNISALQKKRDSYSGNSSSSRSKVIKAKMSQLRCGEEVRTASISTTKGIARTFGNTQQIKPNYTVNIPGGNYRTMCVRPIDGYYFPISFSATKDQMILDAQSCEARCPGAELFYHRNDSEEPEDMRSLQGVAYTNHPNAFRYRTEGVARDNGCKYTEGYRISYKLLNKSSGQPTDAKTIAEPKITENIYAPVPTSRPTPGLNREELIDIRGGMTLERMATMIQSGSTGEALTARKKDQIRVIGPVFLPAEAAVKDLLIPGRAIDQ